MTERTWFLDAAGVLAAIGCGIALVTPAFAEAGEAFTGSMLVSALVGLVFALQNLRVLIRSDRPYLPPAVVTTVFGLWFAVAPLLYDPGTVGTAGVQIAGLVTASFGGYVALAAISTLPASSTSRSREGGL